MEQKQSGEHVWSAEPRAAMAEVAGLMAIFLGLGVLGFFAMGWGDDAAASVEMTRRLLLLGIISGIGIMLGMLMLVAGVREVRASAEGLVIRNWFVGSYRVPRDRIRGVRVYRRRPAVEVVIDRRGNLYLNGANALGPWDAAMSGILVGLYGRHDDDVRYEARATEPEIVEKACGKVEFRVRERAEVYRWHALMSVLLIALGIIQWNRAFQWLTEYQARGEGDLLMLAVGMLVVGIFLLLGAFEAWIWFAHNRVEGVTVSERGIVVRKRWGEKLIAAEEIGGVEVRRTPSSRSPMLWVHLKNRRPWVVSEHQWMAPAGEMAGVLLHRFGEWVPRVREERKPA